jgi:RNA recognition motif-containing protein
MTRHVYVEIGSMKNIYVGNLAYSVSDDDLRDAFSAFGEVARAKVIMDRDTGRSKGFGFVEMPDDGEADAAIAGLNEQPINGRNVRVNEARPRDDRPRR